MFYSKIKSQLYYIIINEVDYFRIIWVFSRCWFFSGWGGGSGGGILFLLLCRLEICGEITSNISKNVT